MKQITVDATIDQIEVVTDFVNAELEERDCPLKTVMQIDVALDEILANVAHYAYPEGTVGKVQVSLSVEPNRITLTFVDEGKPYDPTQKSDPDTTLSADEREIGGLGIFLVKKTMDSIDYEYADGKNVLRITKSF